ncbi:conserved hypothetical protein [Beggiatoa sp. PS]|nr:conserved hypothetical protein [Beggiatoa sp. PS]
MLNAIKQEVTVLSNGVVPFRSPELQAGSRVEVIVIIKEKSPHSQNKNPNKNLLSFMGKGKGAFATPEEADAFIRQERNTWEK